MALHRLAGRLRGHDWFGVAVEVAIVVAGVFIALQVSNWNQERLDSARGREYLTRLRDELRADAESIGHIASFWAAVRANGVASIAHAEGGELVDASAWRTLLSYYHASQVWPYRKPDVTFQEVRSGGELLLIRNAPLRARIAAHYGAGAGSQVVEVLGLVPRYRERIRGLVPWHVQQYYWENCYQSRGNLQELLPCDAPLAEDAARAVVSALRADTQLLADLRFWMVNVNNGLVLLRDVRAEALALAAAIDEELEVR